MPRWVRMGALAALLAGALVLAVWAGAVHLPPGQVLDALLGRPVPKTVATILWEIRLPRVVLAALVGASLAAAGAAFQGLLRNPMADPYLLGVSGGASVGGALALTIGLRWEFIGFNAAPLAAFLGALAAVVLVYGLARTGSRRVSTGALLLAGVAVGTFCTAVLSFLQARAPEQLLRALVNLLAGSVGTATWPQIGAATPYMVAGLAILIALGRDLDLLLLGEEPAEQLGVPLEATKRWVWVGASLATAASVSVAGLIPFVGLIVPHILRLLVGPGHRGLLPAAALGGAAFLVLADTAGRTLWAPQEIRVGVITGLTGAPFFLWLLRQHTRREG